MTLRQVVAGRVPVFLAGLYCVVVAVVPVGLSPAAPGLGRGATWLSLLSLPVGLFVPQSRAAFLAGVVGVIGGGIVTFAVALWAGQAIEVTPLGVLGFFALPLAWGALSSPAARQGIGQGARADWLTPRRSVPQLQVLLAGLAVLTLPLLLVPPLWLEVDAEATFALVAALGLLLVLAPRISDLFTRFWLRRS